MKLAENYIAVGTSEEDGHESCIVVVVGGIGRLLIPEHKARKLADDLLKNANYLWPIEEDKQ